MATKEQIIERDPEPKTWADFGIRVGDLRPGQTGNLKILCPECSADRTKNKGDRCLSVHLEKKSWCCHHCGWSGNLDMGRGERIERRAWKAVETRAVPPSEQMYRLFEGRGIPREIVDRNRITMEKKYFAEFGERNSIAFNYYAGDVLVNIKYRDHQKNFQQVPGGEQIAYGINDIAHETKALISEGEFDKLAFEVAGFRNAISVPCGAINPGDKSVAGKLKFIEAHLEIFNRLEEVYLATDTDAPGLRLRDELARRLGKERCKVVSYPEGCKDANDVLLKFGAAELELCVVRAEPFPLEGFVSPDQLLPTIFENRENGKSGKGADPRIGLLGDKLTFKPGQYTVITGVPNHGKTPLLDQITMNLAVYEDWKIAYATFEHDFWEHETRLLEQLVGKGYAKTDWNSMSDEELRRAAKFLQEHIRYIDSGEEDIPLQKLLSQFEYLIKRHGMNCICIDPWTYIDTPLESKESEHRATGKALRTIRRFVKKWGVHAFIIAHPTKPPNARGSKNSSLETGIPTAYSISGSAHWNNLPNNVLTVHRHRTEDGDEDYTGLYVLKVKDKRVGSPGVVKAAFDVSCQRFRDLHALVTDSRENLLDIIDAPYADVLSDPSEPEPDSYYLREEF